MSTPFSTLLNDFATDLVLARPNPCPNCGPYPCYHICPNSPLYYSPEQERLDDMRYDPSEYYREGGFIDEDYYDDDYYPDDPDVDQYEDEPEIPFDPVELQGQPNPGDDQDIPF